jgi:dTDP-glucose 4,6-dehydratase
MRRLLVTDGAGFIGAKSVHYWLKNHPDDRIVVRNTLTYGANLMSLDSVQGQGRVRVLHGDSGKSTETRVTFV